jgi:uncharacterized RDD family membrane protein YckC
MTDFHDGPRSGIADFEGRPHFYESEWDDAENKYASTFRLSPVTPEVLAFALEDWDIWRRWWTAFEEGRTDQETHPALPEDRLRHVELEGLLRDRLRIDPASCIRTYGQFRTVESWDGNGLAPLEVRWERCQESGLAANKYATFWQRFAALWIDMLVFAPVGAGLIAVESVSRSAALALALPWAGLTQAYTIYGHGRFGKTVGKWAMHIRVARVGGDRIGWREAWLRSSVDLCLSALGVVGRIAALATIADSDYFGIGWSRRSANIAAHEPSWSLWVMRVGMVWFWSEVVTMLFNKRRRALHDFIAGTVVMSEGQIQNPKREDAQPTGV